MRPPLPWSCTPPSPSALCSLPTAAAPPANVEHVETFRGIAQYRLKSNGMTILLAPDRSSPVFTFMVVYHVGSRNEAPGNTGSAHLLEHMIFNKSTENFGKANGHATFQEVLYEAGADDASSNMTTWYDRMNGYSTLPADKLELAMRIEADRMRRALILDSERQSEMSVVRNEYEIGENNPAQALRKALVGTAIQAHPYHWATIGYRSDIEGVTHREAARALPSVLPSRQQRGDPRRRLRRRQRARALRPRVRRVSQALRGRSRRSSRPSRRRKASAASSSSGRATPGSSPSAYLRPGRVACRLLRLRGARLGARRRRQRAAVPGARGARPGDVGERRQLRAARPVSAARRRDRAPGKSHAEVEAALKEALAAVADKGITEAELRRAQQQIEVAVARLRDGPYRVASSLGEAVASADWKWFLTYVDRIKAVGADDVRRVAATYLAPDRATVGWFVPATMRGPRARCLRATLPPGPRLARRSLCGSDRSRGQRRRGEEDDSPARTSGRAGPPAAAPPAVPFAARTVRKRSRQRPRSSTWSRTTRCRSWPCAAW